MVASAGYGEIAMRPALIAGLSLWAAAAHGAELAPMQPLRHELDEDTSAVVVYSAEPSGYRVVATVQQVTETETVLLRITTTLLPGQWADIAVPRPPSEPPAAMRIVREHDVLRVAPAAPSGR